MAATIPTPPRLIGDPTVDLQSVTDWAWLLYRTVVVEAQIIARLDRLAAVTALTQEISNPPTQEEVENVQNTVNAVIAAAGIQTS